MFKKQKKVEIVQVVMAAIIKNVNLKNVIVVFVVIQIILPLHAKIIQLLKAVEQDLKKLVAVHAAAVINMFLQTVLILVHVNVVRKPIIALYSVMKNSRNQPIKSKFKLTLLLLLKLQ
jgi:hypothetical protein